jgi:3-oxoacyl-[acyl-carrier-protein] synthase II
MMGIYISGIGTVCALGTGIGRFENGLESGIVPVLSMATVLQGGAEKEVPYYKAQADEIERFVSPRALRRVDTFSQLALLASYLAVENAKLSLQDLDRAGIVFGSAHGPLTTTFDFIDSIIDNGDSGASPTHFANSVHNAPAAQVSLQMKIKGPCSTLSNFQSTFSAVLLQACQWLEEGRADHIIAGVGEDYCPVEGYALQAAAGHTAERIEPFSLDKCSFIPGQGWVSFLLSSAKTESVYAEISSLHVNESIERITREMTERASALILSAKGNKAENKDYGLLMKKRPGRFCAYSHLYGSFSSGSAFDLAVAALSVKNKKVYSSGMKNDLANEAGFSADSPVLCIESTGKSLFNIYELREPA